MRIMRYGFTTGSCAAAAAKAAAYMLLTGGKKTKITIETPRGIPYTAELLEANGNWEHGVTPDEVRSAFSLITKEWAAGDN